MTIQEFQQSLDASPAASKLAELRRMELRNVREATKAAWSVWHNQS